MQVKFPRGRLRCFLLSQRRVPALLLWSLLQRAVISVDSRGQDAQIGNDASLPQQFLMANIRHRLTAFNVAGRAPGRCPTHQEYGSVWTCHLESRMKRKGRCWKSAGACGRMTDHAAVPIEYPVAASSSIDLQTAIRHVTSRVWHLVRHGPNDSVPAPSHFPSKRRAQQRVSAGWLPRARLSELGRVRDGNGEGQVSIEVAWAQQQTQGLKRCTCRGY